MKKLPLLLLAASLMTSTALAQWRSAGQVLVTTTGGTNHVAVYSNSGPSCVYLDSFVVNMSNAVNGGTSLELISTIYTNVMYSTIYTSATTLVYVPTGRFSLCSGDFLIYRGVQTNVNALVKFNLGQ